MMMVVNLAAAMAIRGGLLRFDRSDCGCVCGQQRTLHWLQVNEMNEV